MTTQSHQSPLLEKWENDELRYSHVWEDFRCLNELMNTEGLPTSSGSILTISSAGENALSLSCKGKRTIYAMDLSFLQIQLSELKKSAIISLGLEDYLRFVGLKQASPEERHALWEQIQKCLPGQSAEFWAQSREKWEDGIIHKGRLDKYFKKFREKVYPIVWHKDAFEFLIHSKTLKEQIQAFQSGDMDVLKQAVTEFFSQQALSQEGRHESQFQYVEKKNIGPIFLKNFQKVIARDLVSQNPYLQLFLTGHVRSDSIHPLYNPDDYESIKSNLENVHFKLHDLESFLSETDQTFDFMNFSDVFEYLSPEEAEKLFQLAASKLNPGGLLAYWTLLVDRKPETKDLGYCPSSEDISNKDQTWFYSRFYGFKKVQ